VITLLAGRCASKAVCRHDFHAIGQAVHRACKLLHFAAQTSTHEIDKLAQRRGERLWIVARFEQDRFPRRELRQQCVRVRDCFFQAFELFNERARGFHDPAELPFRRFAAPERVLHLGGQFIRALGRLGKAFFRFHQIPAQLLTGFFALTQRALGVLDHMLRPLRGLRRTVGDGGDALFRLHDKIGQLGDGVIEACQLLIGLADALGAVRHFGVDGCSAVALLAAHGVTDLR